MTTAGNARLPRVPASAPTGGGSNPPNSTGAPHAASSAQPPPTQRRADLVAAWRHSTGHVPDSGASGSGPPSGAASGGQVPPDAFSSGGAGSITLSVKNVVGGADADTEPTFILQAKDGLPHAAQAKPRVAWASTNGSSGMGPGSPMERGGATENKAAAGPAATAGSGSAPHVPLSLSVPTVAPAAAAVTAAGGQSCRGGSLTQQGRAAPAGGAGAAATDGAGGAPDTPTSGSYPRPQDATSPRTRCFRSSSLTREASATVGEVPVVSSPASPLPSSAYSPAPFCGPHPALTARPTLRALSTLAPAHIAAAAAMGPSASIPTDHASLQLTLPNATADAGLARAASVTARPAANRHQSLRSIPMTSDLAFAALGGMPRRSMQVSGPGSGLNTLRRMHTFSMGPGTRARGGGGGGGDGSVPARVDLRAAVLSSSFSVGVRPHISGRSSPHLDVPIAVAAALGTPGGGSASGSQPISNPGESDRGSGAVTPSRSGPVVPAGGTFSGGVPFLLGASPTPGSSPYSSKMHRAAQMLQRLHGVAMDPSTGTVLVGGEAPRTELPVSLLSLPPPPPAPVLPPAPAASHGTSSTAATDLVSGRIVATGTGAGMAPNGRAASDSRCGVLGGGGGGDGLGALPFSGSFRHTPHLSSAPSPHVATATAMVTGTAPSKEAAAASAVASVEPYATSLGGAVAALQPLHAAPPPAVAAGLGAAAATAAAALGGAATPQAATTAATAGRTGAVTGQVGCVR